MDYKSIIKKLASKKKVLTTTKIQKEAAERRNCIKVKGKYLYILFKRYRCL